MKDFQVVSLTLQMDVTKAVLLPQPWARLQFRHDGDHNLCILQVFKALISAILPRL